MRNALVCIALYLGPVLIGHAAGEGRSRECTLRLEPAAPVRIDVAVGDVQVLGSDRADVRVRIDHRAAGGASLSRVEERIDVAPAGLQVSALQADGAHDARLTSTVVIDVPRTQPVAIALFEGTLQLRGLSGGVSARVTRGAIEASAVGGALRFETTMGALRVSLAAGALTGAVRLRTFNGDIELTLPETPRSARVLALTMNGSIDSALPLTIRTTTGPRFSEATFGEASPVINIDAVNGDIRLATARP